MEVDTPVVVNSPVTDVHIHSAEVRFPDASGRYFLHTSPEFAMKRLLASGSGDIYQICRVARGLERGRQHNAEFTLVEWYRVGFSLEQLMDEVEALARHVLGDRAASLRSERASYADAFQSTLQIDPLTAPIATLRSLAIDAGFVSAELANAAAGVGEQSTKGDASCQNVGAGREPTSRASGAADSSPPEAERDELLEFLMGAVIGPQLGRGALTFVHRYPASQAALARLDPVDPRCALRFELYGEGMELANGFHELASCNEQRARFELDLAERRRRGLPADGPDENLLAALAAGLPDCAGVALGFDRLVMLATGATHIDEVLPFPIERA
jgi:elongation factor P--(R)-beta-lysine ligase